ncbi:hypothetical protein JXB28_05785 [Candidatus Woesearchaeota archaeon]|nr:hypothetical protein [Candidatus Woesearchaeota archaeon]
MPKKKAKKVIKAEARPSPSSSSVLDGKAIAAVSYITWLGLIVAILLNNDKKNEFARYHIRQSLLLLLVSLLPSALFSEWKFIGGILFAAVVILLIMGFVYALNGEKKEVPIFGKLAQDWFKNI